MKPHVNILGRLWIVYSLVVALISIAGMFLSLLAAGPGQPAGELLFVALVSVPGIMGGIGLVKWRAWARVLVLLLGFLNLFSFPPVGTILGAYTIWVLTNRETTQAFHLDRS